MRGLKNLFYSVEDVNGNRLLHIHGFMLDEKTKTEKHYAFCEFENAYIPLWDAIHMTDADIAEFLKTIENTSVKRLDKEEADYLAESFYQFEYSEYHWSGTKMELGKISMSTPAGDYVDVTKEREWHEGDTFFISGNISYDGKVRSVKTTGTVLMSEPYSGKLMCQFDEMEGERLVTVYCDKDLLQTIA